MNEEQMTPQPLTVWLWDEIGGEWGPAYPKVSPEDNSKVHAETMKFIDIDNEADDHLKYRLNVEGVGINIGFWGRHALYIELWGDKAEAMVNVMKAELDWFPNTAKEALEKLTLAHDLVSD